MVGRRPDRDLLLGGTLLVAATFTGVRAISEAIAATRRVPEWSYDGSQEGALHLAVALAFAAWLVRRIALRSRFAPRTASHLRVSGWAVFTTLALGFFAYGSGARGGLLVVLATTIIPVIPALIGGLFVDLGLLLVFRGWPEEPDGLPLTPGIAFAGMYAGLVPVALAGIGCFQVPDSFEPARAPTLIQAVGASAIWAFLLLLVLTPVAFVWLLYAATRR